MPAETFAHHLTGAYVPEEVLTNADLEKVLDTNDKWIVSRTGIKERRILNDPAKGTSYMAIKAANDLLKKKTFLQMISIW